MWFNMIEVAYGYNAPFKFNIGRRWSWMITSVPVRGPCYPPDSRLC